jgi:ligand-binding sensor domain-containing protein
MKLFKRRRLLLLFSAAAAAGAMLFIPLRRAHQSLTRAENQLASESQIRFSIRQLDPTIPAGLEFIGSPAVFSDATLFNGHLFIAGPAGLSEYDPSSERLHRYRPGQELPSAPVTAIAIGTGPTLWIATSGEGFVAFDGRSFRQIRPDDPRLRKINSIVATETGRVVLGTEKGVFVYDGHEIHSFVPDAKVTALAGDDTNLWIGTLDRGLLHWNAGTLESIMNLPDVQVLSIALDGENVYAGTALGVFDVRAGRTLAEGYFAQSLYARDGKLYVGTLDEGLVEVSKPKSRVCDGCSIKKIFRPAKDIGDDILALAEDSLWRGAQQILHRESDTLVDRNISALSMDSGGRLWIGYFDRGLQILNGPSFEDDHLFCINRIAHDPARGISAVATANGLVMFDASTSRRRVITHDDGLIANQITDVVLRPDGSAVAATPAGISFIDATGISSIYAFQGLVNNHVYALATDGPRTLAGTLGGLSILDGSMVKASYTTANSALKHNWITAIVRSGDDWYVGTYGAGVFRTDGQSRWQTFEEFRTPVEINPNAMIATANAVYAGTLERGLAVYSSGHWNFWTAGLPSLNVTALESRNGVLYVGTDNGLIKLPESTVTR